VPSAAFEMSEPDLLLEFLIVMFDVVVAQMPDAQGIRAGYRSVAGAGARDRVFAGSMILFTELTES
jgi:hypothetical protein